MKNGTESPQAEAPEDILSKAVFVLDTDGTINWTNQAFRTLCGYSKFEIVGQSAEEFLLNDQTDLKSARALRLAITNSSHSTVELMRHHKKGRPYWVSIELTPIKNKVGRFSGFIAVEHDVTEEHACIGTIDRRVAQ